MMHESTKRKRRLRQKRRAAHQRAYEVWLPETLVDTLKRPDESISALVSRALDTLTHEAAAPPDTLSYEQRREALVQRLRAMHAEGLSLQAMANRLNREAAPTFSGRGRWQKGTISDLLSQAEAVQS
jgi:hypothetical protein